MQQGIAHTVVVHIVSDVVGGGLGLGGRIAHRDPDAGVGEHIRVIAAIAEEIGMKSEFRNIAWDGIFASLESGQANVIASCVTIQYRNNYLKVILKSFRYFSVIPP